MASLPATQTECSKTSSELIQLLFSIALDAKGYDREFFMGYEIKRKISIINMLNAPPYVEGIVYLDGMVIPIFSLRKRLY